MGGNKESGSSEQQGFRVHRVGTFGRKDLAEISLHYTLELMGVEQPALDKKTADKYELGRRAL